MDEVKKIYEEVQKKKEETVKEIKKEKSRVETARLTGKMAKVSVESKSEEETPETIPFKFISPQLDKLAKKLKLYK